MKISRREFLAGVCAAALFVGRAEAWVHGSVRGWSTIPLGAGGLITGFDFADDKSMVVKCDTNNAYVWGTATRGLATYEDVGVATNRWWPLLTYSSMVNAVAGGFNIATNQPAPTSGMGVYDVCFAPSDSNRILLITFDLTTQSTSNTKQGVYLSSDRGLSFRMVNDATNFPTFTNAPPNDSYAKKTPQNKIAIDPANKNVMYVGMPYQSGNTYPVYRSTDGGTTWDGTWTSGAISDATAISGANCFVFDRNAGTVTAFGQTVSKRMMFGVNGIGMYETVDGGVSWTLTTGGPTTFYAQSMDYDGRVYVTNAANTTIHRYDPNGTAGGGTWYALSSGSGFPSGMSGNISSICCDHRNGGQGKLWMSRGGLHGYYSANAQNTTINSVSWVGHSGTPVGSYNPAPNDLPWSEKTRLLQTLNVAMRLDANGVVWQCGTQDFWYADMPIYANGASTAPVVLNSVGRGIEQTVTAAVVRPPLSPYVFIGVLDVGLFKKVPTSTAYPSYTDWWQTGDQVANRLDCTGIDFARSDPSFMVTRAQVALSNDPMIGKYSGYAANYAASGWSRYATMPDSLYDQATNNVNGGYIIPFDADNHLCVIGGTVAFVPCYTANARSPSCSWSLCSDLPSVVWLGTPDSAPYKVSHTFDADYVNIGTAYGYNPSNGDIWRSTNYGVNWTNVGNKILTNGTRPFLYTVPNYAGYFYLTAQFSTSSGKLWKYVQGGSDASPIDIPLPSGVTSVYRIALGISRNGAAAHPALYLIGWTGFFTQLSLWRSDLGDGSDWVQFGGVLQQTKPALTQLDTPRIFAADWVEYGKVYLGAWGSGFSVFRW